MKIIEPGTKIEWNQMVGAIFKIDGIHYQRFEMGRIPEYPGESIEAFIGSSQEEIHDYAAKRVDELNSCSPAYLERERLWKLEKKERGKRAVRKKSRSIPKKDLIKLYEHIGAL